MTYLNFNLNLGELTEGILSSNQKALFLSRERDLTSSKPVQYNKHRRSRGRTRLPCRAV